ncbi:hypothetical protein NEC86_002601 [Escherichia coli]|nr:hypothetical protein [Escherichia coli]
MPFVISIDKNDRIRIKHPIPTLSIPCPYSGGDIIIIIDSSSANICKGEMKFLFIVMLFFINKKTLHISIPITNSIIICDDVIFTIDSRGPVMLIDA